MQSAANTQGSGENAVRSEINVTPLVDVCLVLLIIFMVVTPLLVNGVDVTLPQTTSPDKMPERGNELKVSLKADGSVHLGSDWVPQELLVTRFKELHSSNPEQNIVLRGDKSLKYKDVRKLIQIMNEAGFAGVGIVTQKREEPR